MTPAFRPTVETLDARDLPSVTVTTTLQFDMPGDVVATGTFTFPEEAVDPTLAAQAIELGDLEVVAGEQTFEGEDFGTTPTANFLAGQFVGVTFTVAGEFGGPFAYLAAMDTAAATILASGEVFTSAVSATNVPDAGGGAGRFNYLGPPPIPDLDWPELKRQMYQAYMDSLVAQYQADRLQLLNLQVGLQMLMDERDYYYNLWRHTIDLINSDADVNRIQLMQQADALLQQLVTVESNLSDKYAEYNALWLRAAQEFAFLDEATGGDRTVVPLLPNHFIIPPSYFQELDDAWRGAS